MLNGREDILAAFEKRRRFIGSFQADRSATQRLADWTHLQQASFQILMSSPDGYRHFVRRNMESRRTEVIDGQWRPVSPARRAQQP